MARIESVPTSLCKIICKHQCKNCYLPEDVVDAEQVKAAGEHILNELGYIISGPWPIYNSETYLVSGATLQALKDTADALMSVVPNKNSEGKQ